MSNPYEVLGVSKDSSNEEVKQAYKQIARRYHASNFEDNPVSDVAESKMKELDQAYDLIMSERMNPNAAGGAYTQADLENGNAAFYTGPSQYPDVRKHIDNSRYDDALTILEGIPTEVRTAEWFYLKGIVQQKQGWIEEAYNNLKIANDMDPYNNEYKNALEDLTNIPRAQQNYYGNTRNPRKSTTSGMGGGCGPCDLCMGLMCLDTCCDCCDGDGCCCC